MVLASFVLSSCHLVVHNVPYSSRVVVPVEPAPVVHCHHTSNPSYVYVSKSTPPPPAPARVIYVTDPPAPRHHSRPIYVTSSSHHRPHHPAPKHHHPHKVSRHRK
jgi:hypothetical protein